MDTEELLKKYIDVKKLMEKNDLLVASGLVIVNEHADLKEAEALLAKTTKMSADVLAETTQVSADLLAEQTQQSAEALKKSNAISVQWMQRLTIALLAVGLIQIAVAVITLLKV